MIPLRDINPTRRFPFVTIVLIAINVAVFLYQQSLGSEGLNQLIWTAGVIPYQVSHGLSPAVARDFITSMFLHGGWVHLLGNMLYLWIFGNNIEDVLGHVRYIVFYLLCGALATVAHVVTNIDVRIPTIGASGAIAGILGAYLVLFPRARVQTVVFFFYFIRFVEVPAIIVLGFWFVLQFISGITVSSMPTSAGVAYFAHIGGFVAGASLIFLFRIGQGPGPPRRRQPRRRDLFREEYPDLWD